MDSAQEVLQQLPDALIVLDSDARVIGWHGAAEKLFGWTAKQIEGQSVNECFKPEDDLGNKCCIGPCDPSKISKTDRFPEYDARVTTKDGEQTWVGVNTSLHRDASGNISRMVVIARDVSRRKSVDLEKSEVISAVSHELRSPLTSVKGFTSTLLNKWDRFDDDTKKHLLKTINSDADRVTRLLTELLDISRIEASRLQLNKQEFDVGGLASKVVDRLQAQADKHKLVLDFAAPLPRVLADPDKIEQVLTNLVENAIKYTDGGSVRIYGEVDDGHVKVCVLDEGEGIPEDQRAQVFGKFFRHGEKRENPSGTGLGLYIARGLVDAQGGKIWVEDGSDGGSLFAFTLPVAEE